MKAKELTCTFFIGDEQIEKLTDEQVERMTARVSEALTRYYQTRPEEYAALKCEIEGESE